MLNRQTSVLALRFSSLVFLNIETFSTRVYKVEEEKLVAGIGSRMVGMVD